ncbi:MAG TPA: hypothetical protein P5538_08000 [Bacteroidales bacterium]|jgi:hypothetical protein|nr:hypothetical protein [Bacteroidales bacterium]HOL98715.1 hypothetical protein [Bacteroidales bacterium]HOM36977.1 hypothetical protein [Bacteroidales bacterium]HPD24600.1 hypothetical protein [Bacteroidales bacterium]HRT00376.1 hypothetical protein [Bacteroidales bacterium]
MRIKSFFFFILLFVTFLNAQENTNLYSGGMLILQPGYTLAKNNHQEIQTTGLGVGGILRFYVYENLTLGITGGNQKTKYLSTGSHNSFISLGYGGPFVGYTKKGDFFRFCASIGFAKGRIKNLHIESQQDETLNEAYFYNYKANVIFPILSLDYLMTKKISLTSQFIFLSAKYNQNDLYFCPVFQVGILFNR